MEGSELRGSGQGILAGERSPEEKRQIAELERKFFTRALSANGRSDVIEELRTCDSALADFAEGTLMHEQFRQYAESMSNELVKAYPDVQYTNITREQADAVFARFGHTEELHTVFMKAHALYEKSIDESVRPFGGKWITPVDVRLVNNDAIYLRSISIPEQDDRDPLLMDSEKELIVLIDSFIKEDGKKAEYQVIFLLRHLLREQGLEHLMQVTHGLPREDRKDGVDIRVVAGGEYVDFDLKLFDEYKEHTDLREGVFQERLQALKDKRGSLHSRIAPVVDKRVLDTAYGELKGDRSVSSAELLAKQSVQKIIQFLIQYTPENQTHIRGVLGVLLERKKKKPKVELPREKQFDEFQNVVKKEMFNVFENTFTEMMADLYDGAMGNDREAFMEIKAWLIDAILDVRERDDVEASVKKLSPKKFIERLKKDSRLQQLVAEELRSYEFE